MIENGGLVTRPTIITASLTLRIDPHHRLDALDAKLRGPAEQRLHRRRTGDVNQFNVEIIFGKNPFIDGDPGDHR